MALSRRIRRNVVDLLDSSTTIPFGERMFAAAPPAPATVFIEVPFEFTSREYACMLLHIAAGIEHALMVQYLYAGYSLGGAQVPADKAALVRQWQEAVLGIAKEEMGHLMTVQNLLRCVGGSLTLDRGDFPWDSDFYPFDFRLEPLTRKSLAKYVITESPDDGSFSGAEAELIRKLAEEDSDGKPVNRVGALYDRLIAIFQDPQMIPDSAFRDETFLYQANWDEWGRGHRVDSKHPATPGTADMLVMPVSSRSDAVKALQAVATQGESPVSAEGTASHFARFLKIFRGFPEKAEWYPARNVAVNPVTVRHPDRPDNPPGTTPISNEEASLWAHLLNVRYRNLLTTLLHTFHYPNQLVEASQFTPRGLLIHATFGEMYNLRTISEILMGMPVAKAGGQTTKNGRGPVLAGPPFQMPYNLTLPTDPVDRWNLQLELLRASGVLIEKLADVKKSPHQVYLGLLKKTDAETMDRIETVLDALPQPCQIY